MIDQGTDRMSIDPAAGPPAPGLAWAAEPAWRGASKRAMDVALAAALSLLAGPLILALMALVRLTSRGPAIYSQTRLGRFGRPYMIYKIRTMAHECEKHSGVKWSVKGDPRVTPLGRVLRVTHLDELPQLWNVLRGDMSLVGPRPERPEFVAELERVFPYYRERMLVRPGVTGLAQVQLPPDVDVAGVGRKLACDLLYIRSSTPWLDLRIIAATGLGVLGLPFVVSRVLLRIPTGRDAERAYRLLPGVEAVPPQMQPA
jgi:lipopolysaccharide/colanic/teichoic acid biosynthesis glycosyltransferase